MKKKILGIIVAILVVLLGVGIIYFNNQTLDSITTKKFNKVLATSGEKLVYIGRPTCPGCQELKPIIEDKLEAEKIKAYYYNTDKAKKESMDTFNKIKEDLALTSVPVVIYYDGNKEIKRVEYSDYKEDETLLDNIIKEYKSKTN